MSEAWPRTQVGLHSGLRRGGGSFSPLILTPNSRPQGNYVLDRDELVEAQKPEYDVVLCLSLTKWVHLNWGDEGLKRMFRRIYRHLRPGGILVLEPQPWSSYGRRKTLTVCAGFFGNWGSPLVEARKQRDFLMKVKRAPQVGLPSLAKKAVS